MEYVYFVFAVFFIILVGVELGIALWQDIKGWWRNRKPPPNS